MAAEAAAVLATARRTAMPAKALAALEAEATAAADDAKLCRVAAAQLAAETRTPPAGDWRVWSADAVAELAAAQAEAAVLRKQLRKGEAAD